MDELKCKLIKNVIHDLENDQRLMINVRKDIPFIDSPADLDEVLHDLGWSLDDSEGNGWEPDCWCFYSHLEYNFGLVMSYNGFYWSLELYRSDIDDD